MSEYLAWGHERLASDFGVQEPPGDPTLIRDSLAHNRPPRGILLLAECDGQPAGVGALRMLSVGVAEVKRMYVAPRWRDRHLGSSLLDRLLAAARDRSASIVRLDSVRFMAEAQRLYRSRGFVECPPYEGTEIPPHLQQYGLFFERVELPTV
jgi:GNAT superfamily N-acetyltransferase